MEKNRLVNMAVLKSFFNNKKDILEVYVPFVEYAIVQMDKEYIDTSELKLKIDECCNLKLPITTIITILKKLTRNEKIITYDKHSKIKLIYSYNDENLEYLKCFEKVDRDKNKLILDYKKFAKKEDIPDEQIMNLFISFINCNIECLDILDADFKSCSTQDAEMVSIADYCIHIKNYDDYNYNVFKEIYYGFLLYNVTQSNSYKGLFSDKKVRKLEVLFDSSFLFRILNLQNDLLNYASSELLQILKAYGYKLTVFSETIDEVRKVLNSIYDTMLSGGYPERVSQKEADTTDGVLGSIYRRGMDLYTFREYIDDIDNEVISYGITILSNTSVLNNIKYDEEVYYRLLSNKLSKYLSGKVDTKIDVNDLKKDKLNISKLILSNTMLNSYKYKALLDIKILKYIENRRHGKRYNFAECGVIFLTCDNVLYTFNSSYHSFSRSIPEAVTEEVFTNVLWVNKPDIIRDIPLTRTLSIFQTSKYVQFGVLSKFNNCIKDFVKKKPDESKYLGDIYKNQELISRLNKVGDTGDNSEEYLQIIEDCIKKNKGYFEELEISHKNEMESAVDKLNQLEEYKESSQKEVQSIKDELENLKIESSEKISQEKQKHYNSVKMIKDRCDRVAKRKHNIIRFLVCTALLLYIIFLIIYCVKNGMDKTKSLITFIMAFPPITGLLCSLIFKQNLKKIIADLPEIFQQREYKKFNLSVEEIEKLSKCATTLKIGDASKSM